MKINKNDYFSKLRGFDLQQLLLEIDNTLIEYRDTLGLPKYLTFGTELEYEGISQKYADKFIKDYNGWKSKFDTSLESGGEIISPIMFDDIKYWKELEEVCRFLKNKKSEHYKQCQWTHTYWSKCFR